MGFECPGQSGDELGLFTAHAVVRQTSEGFGVAFTIGQGGEHGAGGDPGEVGDDAGEFDTCAFEEFLQPVDLAGPVTGDGGPGSGQVTQFTDLRWWHEGRTHQSVGSDLSEPGSVVNIGFTAGNGFHVAGVDQHHFTVREVFQQVVVGPPVVTGGFHHDAGDLLRGEMIA